MTTDYVQIRAGKQYFTFSGIYTSVVDANDSPLPASCLLPASTQLQWASFNDRATFDDGVFLNTTARNRVDDDP
jgi:hypothetical protein